MAKVRSVREVFNAHERFSDSLTDRFDRRIRRISARASVRLIRELEKKLDLADGLVIDTPNNQRVLRGVPKLFEGILEDLGYNNATKAFAEQFPKQLPFVRDTFRAINKRLKTPLPLPSFSADDPFITSRIISTDRLLRGEAFRVAESAAQNALLGVGATNFDVFREALALRTGRLQTNVSALASTVISTNFRVINNRAYEVVEEERGDLMFVYFGPDDKLNRPFCRSILDNNIPRTREEINALDNLTILEPVFMVAGGFNCRHIWIPATSGGGLLFKDRA